MLKPGNFVQKSITLILKGRLILFTHGAVDLIPDKLILLFVQHPAADTHFLRDVTGRHQASTELPDSLTLYLLVYAGDEPSLGGMTFIQPAIQHYITGIA
ncbi:hypothetical protein HW114_14660 [Serratia symbiotica]|nr:hypothetical protein [Serratia symbiotica]